jgi:cob(I)alamin adenosyltransferase
MGTIDDAIKELKEISAHLAVISANLNQRDKKSDESLNVIRKDLWNIKNVVADENIQNKIVQKGVERALAKLAAYLAISGLMLYVIAKFLLLS